MDTSWVPPLLPTRHFVPDLADLLYPTSIRIGREVTACAVHTSITGLDPRAASAALGQRPATGRHLRQCLQQLARQGRVEQFLSALQVAAKGVAREQVDYSARRRFLEDPERRRVLRETLLDAVPDADPWILKSWLVDQWACTYTAGHERLTSRDGRLERYDRDHGVALTHALEIATKAAA